MTADELERYLHAHIPLSRHMGMRVAAAESGAVDLTLPLAPNVNPHGTVFGGALTATGLVSAWMVLFAAFERAGLEVKLVGKEVRCEFLAPADGDCVSRSRVPVADLDALVARVAAEGRARQTVTTSIRVGEVEVARHQGVYTAILESKARQTSRDA
jgi:thioesterase domain-containing protein